MLTAECRTPRGADIASIKACAEALSSSVHALYVPESEDGVRMSSLVGCGHLAHAGAESIMALLTRDMNRIALQAAILGAASMGQANVFCTAGRHQALTSAGSAKGVFDLDPIQLLQVANGMRKDGLLADGQALDAPVDLLLGTDTNPFSDPAELQVLTLEKAASAGADFVITAPVFNLDKFNIWMSHVRERELHKRVCIVASIMPIVSAREAIQLAEKFTYLDIRDEDVHRLDTAQDPRAAGLHLAAETIAYVRKVDGVRGVHVTTGEDFALAAEVIKTSGLSRS